MRRLVAKYLLSVVLMTATLGVVLGLGFWLQERLVTRTVIDEAVTARAANLAARREATLQGVAQRLLALPPGEASPDQIRDSLMAAGVAEAIIDGESFSLQARPAEPFTITFSEGDRTATLIAPPVDADPALASYRNELESRLSERRNRIYGFGIAAALTVLGAGLFWAWLAARRLVEPLRQLARGAVNIGRGDFSSTTEIERYDEVGDLARAFDSMRERLRETTISRDYLDKLLASMSEAVLVTNTDGEIERVNRAAVEMLGYDSEPDLLGRSLLDLVTQDSRSKLQGGPSRSARECTFLTRDGTRIPVSFTDAEVLEGETVTGRILSAQDISERKRSEQRIRYLARVDALTKLPNRMQFQHLLQQTIARARKSREYAALLYIDIDRFKDINDTFGHAAGDRSLETFAERINESIPESAIAGRLAGDEFAVVVTGIKTMDGLIHEVAGTARRLLNRLGDPFQVQHQEIFGSASIGVALHPTDADNTIDLIRNADAALYQAKKSGGNCFEFYSPDMTTAAVERLMLKSKLRRAFEHEELRLHYQPKYDLRTGRIEGAEALVRWDVPDRGLVFPNDFIPLAEETNLILQIGDWVLNRVCADYQMWLKQLTSPGRVSMNLSLKQLRQRNFLERVQAIFRAHGVSPTCLELEITETTLMEDSERTIKILDAFYGMGLHLSIDDFGTGYSSLSALQQFPINTLKIDRSFVESIPADKDDATIVATIISMGRSLNMDVVAEGVESEEQLRFLRKHGCDYVQGHLFGDPVPAPEYCQLLLDQQGGTSQFRALFA